MAGVIPETKIRCSATNSYGDCARRAATSVIAEDIAAAGHKLRKTTPSVASHIGTGVHSASAMMLVDKLASGTWSLDAALDAGVDSMRLRCEQEGASWDGDVRNMAEAERQVIRMSRAYSAVVAPKIQPIDIENRLEANLGGGFVLSGQSDVTAREPDTIRDTKTGAQLGSYRPQIGGYGRLQRSWNMPATKGVIDFIRRGSLNKDQAPPVEIEIDIAAAEAANERVVDDMIHSINVFRYGSDDGRIRPGDPWAFIANPSSRLCSPKWCAAWGSTFCKEHQESTS